MSNDTFVGGLLADFEEKGFGELVSDDSIKSLVDDTVVSLEPLVAGSSVEDAETVGVRVFTDGVLVLEANYDDDDFERRVTLAILSDLQAV